jgi:protein-disulfide isomerase
VVAKNVPVRKQSRSGFYALLGAVALVGAAAIGWAVTRDTAVVSKIDPSIPLPTAEGYVVGSPDAPVEIIEFADFECPGCGQFAAVTEPDLRTKLIETGQVRFRFMDFPLPIHKNTLGASLAAACANAQGKFWPMHDRIFLGQNDWNGFATSNPRKVFVGYAQELGLDVAAWEQCYDARQFLPQIEANRNAGMQRGVNATPTFIVGDRMLSGPPSFDNIKALVDTVTAEAKAKAAAGSAPASAPAPTP